MKTTYLKISQTTNPAELDVLLQPAAEVIKRGGLVAFPTETVYGLGANALDEAAVRAIFDAKQRPADNPLIVHLAEATDMSKYARQIPEMAGQLAAKFWPGPLTLVLEKADVIPLLVTAGSNTVTLRVPKHPIAQALMRLAGVPIAAPSANTSGRPSPTMAEDVRADLDGKIDLIIDGGPTDVGVESTVLDLVLDPPTILRPGKITIEDLRPLLPNVQLLSDMKKISQESLPVRSPGLKYKHYSPNSTVVLIHAKDEASWVAKVNEFVSIAAQKNQQVAIISQFAEPQPLSAHHLILSDASNYAHQLFHAFRQFEQQQVSLILVQAIPETGLGRAVMDRLTRAADEEIWV